MTTLRDVINQAYALPDKEVRRLTNEDRARRGLPPIPDSVPVGGVGNYLDKVGEKSS